MKLAAFCSKKLEVAQKKVEVLLKKGDSFEVRPFDEEGALGEEGAGGASAKKKQKTKKEEGLL